jgi:hypothetical protein
MQNKDDTITAFIDGARLGRTEWWRFIISAGFIVFSWLFIGSLPFLAIAIWTGAPVDELGQIEGYPLLSFVGLMLSFVTLFLAVWGAVRLFHHRSLHSLTAPNRPINWRRAAQGFGVWLALAAFQAVIEALLFPGRYQWTFDFSRFLQFLLPVLAFVPIQSAAEELLFRGYLLQWLGLRFRSTLFLSFLTGVLFGLLHMGNPEAVNGDLLLMLMNYSAAGIFFALITLYDNGLELALGVHAANNLFATLLANYKISVLSTPALFTIQEMDAVFSLIAYLVSIALFFAFVFWSRSHTSRSAA